VVDTECIYKTIVESLRNGREVALATMIETDGSTPNDVGSRMLVFPDGSIMGTVGGGKLEALCIQEALSVLSLGKSRKVIFDLTPEGIGMECSGRAELFIEVFGAKLKLLIMGGGHVAQKIGELAFIVGIPHSVADDRTEFANRERFPHASAIYTDAPASVMEKEGVNERTYIIIATRGHEMDGECLTHALKTKAAYIGMVGSRSKVPSLYEKLKKNELHPDKDPRVFSPIGLDLGGKEPGAVALSIMAEIMKIHHERTGGHLRMPPE
jgi:xanthine dehydrogenase accessory factor